MKFKEQLKMAIEAGVSIGVFFGTVLFIIVTSVLWWDNTFTSVESGSDKNHELNCYKTLDKESCEKLFNQDNI